MSKRNKSLSRIAIWLVPRRPERFELESLIRALADQFSSPAFVPHVTIYSCQRTLRQQELGAIAALARHYGPISFDVSGLQCSHKMTQALFLGLRSCAAAAEFHQALHHTLPLQSAYKFSPHLSLLYQNLKTNDQLFLRKNIILSSNSICCDQLRVVAIPERIERLEDLMNWQTLLICQLASVLPGDII